MLRAQAGTYVPHPHPIAVCEDTAVLGDAVFYLPTHWPWSQPWLALWSNIIGWPTHRHRRHPEHPTKRLTQDTQEKLGRPADTPCPSP